MTPSEVGLLLAKLSTVDARKVTAEMADSWADILDRNIGLKDAWWAARQHYADRPDDYLRPGHINAAVRLVRRRRVRDMRAEPPPPDGLGVMESIAWSKAYIEAVASGADDPDLTACQQLNITRPEPGPAITQGRVSHLITQTTTTLTEGASA